MSGVVRFIQPIFSLSGDGTPEIHSWEMNQLLTDALFCERNVKGSTIEDRDLVNIHHAMVALSIHPNLLLAVNIRIDMLVGKYGTILCDLLIQKPSVSNRLTLEMVEHGFFTSEGGRKRFIDEAVSTLKAIRSIGVGLSIDDYGTGHNSAEVGLWGVWDEIKIDRVIINHAADGMALAQKMVNGMTSMYRSEGIRVVFEGIETDVMMDLAVDNNADAVQGYHLSRPVMIDSDDLYASPNKLFDQHHSIINPVFCCSNGA